MQQTNGLNINRLFYILGHSQVNMRSESRKMHTNWISSEYFCKSVFFKSLAELKASSTLRLSSQNTHQSTKIVKQKNANNLRALFGNTLEKPCQESNNVKPFADFLAESNINVQSKEKGSYFWSTLWCNSKILKNEQANRCGYLHSETKKSIDDIANKENFLFPKQGFFLSILNTCSNSTETKDVTDTLNTNAQDTVNLKHNTKIVKDANCFGSTDLKSQVREESQVQENNDLVAAKQSMECKR